MNDEEEHLHTNLTISSSSSFVSTKEVQEEMNDEEEHYCVWHVDNNSL